MEPAPADGLCSAMKQEVPPADQDAAAQYLHTLLATYMVQPSTGLVAAPQQPVASDPTAAAAAANDSMQTLLQSTLNAAVGTAVTPGIPQLSLAQPLTLLQQPAAVATDAVQVAALLAAMQDPTGQQRYAQAARVAASAGIAGSLVGGGGAVMAAGDGVLQTLRSATSDDGGAGTGVGAREKNRQAQQRFRQRQKDRIRDLEDENMQLKEQLSSQEQQLAELREENKILQAKLEGKLQLLESIQQVQQQQQQQQQPLPQPAPEPPALPPPT